MPKDTGEFFKRAMQDHLPPMGATEATIEGVKEGVRAFAPGLSLSKIFSDIAAELKEQAAHGSHEVAAALFNGSAYVLYPRQGHDDGPQHGLPEQEKSRDGREL